MVRYLDNKKKEIQKGFYRDLEDKELLFFTGEYDYDGLPIFDNESHTTRYLPSCLIRKLSRVDKKEIKIILKNLEEKANWLEEKLNE
jgi:hypothetical protein